MSGSESMKVANLMDEEIRQSRDHREKVNRVTLEIESILLREDFTMGDLGEVMDMFNSRAHTIFSKTKIKSIKESYERT